MLRRRFGHTQAIQKGVNPRAFVTFALARLFGVLGLQKANEHKLPVSFDLIEAIPGATN